MRTTTFIFVSAAILLQTFSSASHAKLSAKINLSSQKMTVYENGKKKHVWTISSGKDGYFTPNGNYRPHTVKRMHYSKKYNNAPMPYTVFFRGGYAVHGTKATWKLGQPASHGCIRLRTTNAKKFHDLVNKHGKKSTSIKVVGRTPSKTHVRIVSSSKIRKLKKTRRVVRLITKKNHNKRKYTASSRHAVRSNRTARQNRYQARGFNSPSYRQYSARMRQRQKIR